MSVTLLGGWLNGLPSVRRCKGTALVACICLVGSGCASPTQEAGAGNTAATATAAAKPSAAADATARSRGGRAPAPPRPATVDTAEAPLGRVVTANLILKFTVIDFGLRPMPAIGVEMQLYRGAQRVGQVRISGPVLDGHIVADIIAGDAATGDEARLD